MSAGPIALQSNLPGSLAVHGQEVQSFDQQEIVRLLPVSVEEKNICDYTTVITRKSIVGPHQDLQYIMFFNRIRASAYNFGSYGNFAQVPRSDDTHKHLEGNSE